MPLNQSDWIAIASGAVSVCALGTALYAIRRSNRNSSVATLVTMNEAFRQAWQRFLRLDSDKEYEFNELLNLLEIGCGILLERSLFGVSRELMCEYVEHNLLLIERHDDTRQRLVAAVHSPKTFKYIRKFRSDMRKRHPDLGLIPLNAAG